MKNLIIHIIDQHFTIVKRIPYVVGEIIINDFHETFDMPLDWWSVEDYTLQWHEGLERIKTHNQSCLITKIRNPQKGPFIDWWLLYKENKKIFIRNAILMREYYAQTVGSQPFTPQTCYEFIRPKKARQLPDGQLISEWVITLPRT